MNLSRLMPTAPVVDHVVCLNSEMGPLISGFKFHFMVRRFLDACSELNLSSDVEYEGRSWIELGG